MDVRLNTNESPLPPPAAWLDALPGRPGRHRLQPLPRPPGVGPAPAPGREPRRRPDQVFCANGSNEVLQCLLLAYGGPGRTVALFEPTYTLHRHIARITGTDGGRRSPDRRLRLDLDEVPAGDRVGAGR